jgi:hypothetical protein
VETGVGDADVVHFLRGKPTMRHTFVLICGLCALAIAAGWTLIQATTEHDNAVLLHADGTWTTHASSATQRTVVLHPDGTWAYRGVSPVQRASLPAIAAYRKPDAASAYVAGDMVPYGIWLNPHTWRRDTETPDKVFERRFTHISGEAWGAVIAEPTRLSFDDVKSFVLQSARKHMVDTEIVLQEKRLINGHDVMFLNMQGKYRSAPLTYLNYFYAGEEGTVQVYTWTLQASAEKYEQDMLNLLNGFDIKAQVN